MSAPHRNADAIADFALGMRARPLPPEALEAARFAVTDWFGCALGAFDQPPAGSIARVVRGWGAQGRSRLLPGGDSSAPAAALVNGTMAHCLDFDDTHVGSIAHLSGPTWAAAFAVGCELGSTPREMLNAFVAGFEVGARLGNGGFGVGTNERHIHSTGVFGCLGAAVAAGVLYQLDATGVRRAIGLAATQVGGLTASFGTQAKPFHAGKAAFNGVLAAQMAREGYDAAQGLVEPGAGLDRALVQDQAFRIEPLDFSQGWEVTRNTFKPYASCLLTHPVIDAARLLAPRLEGRVPSTVRVIVHPLAIQLAGQTEPATPFAGKFSLAFCTALALHGRTATQTDFVAETLGDAPTQQTARKVELLPRADLAVTAASVEVQLEDGSVLREHTPLALGNPGRPMSWGDMERKFTSLVEPALGDRSAPLFARLRRFGDEASLAAVLGLIEPQR